MSYEEKRELDQLMKKHAEIGRLIRSGRARLDLVSLAPSNQEFLTNEKPLPPLEPFTPDSFQENPETLYEARETQEVKEIAIEKNDTTLDRKEDPSPLHSIENSIFCRCPVKGCVEYLNRETYFTHLVTYHSCKFSSFMKDMRIARDRFSQDRSDSGYHLGTLRLSGKEAWERQLMENFFFQDKIQRSSFMQRIQVFQRLQNEEFQSHLCAVINAKERKELNRLLPTSSTEAKVNDILAIAVCEACELSEESKVRFARFVAILASLLKTETIKSLTHLSGLVRRSVQAPVSTLHTAVINALITGPKFPLTDPDIPGSIVDAGTCLLTAVGKFVAKFILQLRSKITKMI